jgi:hypothetical protein
VILSEGSCLSRDAYVLGKVFKLSTWLFLVNCRSVDTNTACFLSPIPE